MAHSDMVKELVRPPFQNYDIVVYFGCGLFALPFVKHYYLDPMGLRFPNFQFEIGLSFANTVISTLALLFSVYIVGHIIAYISSQFIEKTMDSFLGKTSTIVLLSAEAPPAYRNKIVRRQIAVRSKGAFQKSSRVASVGRALFHLPVIPFYVVIVWLGIFGFYASRVPPAVLSAVRSKAKKANLKNSEVAESVPWFKAVEGYVINNYPTATARMYNYLVISGLFRSVSFIFLASLWFEMAFLVYRLFSGHVLIGIFMSDADGIAEQVWAYLVLALIYIFSLFSYLKFQRRYVEEAMFAFALTNE